MTREEALKVVEETDTMMLPSWQVKNIINAIFNDIETRTCENCKYYTHSDTIPYIGMECTANNGAMSIVCFPPPTFGCNKFEREQD